VDRLSRYTLRYTITSSMTDYQGLALASVLSISFKGLIAVAPLPSVQIRPLQLEVFSYQLLRFTLQPSEIDNRWLVLRLVSLKHIRNECQPWLENLATNPYSTRPDRVEASGATSRVPSGLLLRVLSYSLRPALRIPRFLSKRL
jgi:hypothetical protein